MNNLEAMIKEVVKEALREVLAETSFVAPVTVNKVEKPVEEKVAEVKEEKKVAPKTEKVAKETKKEEPVNEGQTPDPTATVSNDRRAELEAMSFKDLQAIVKELGEKAAGGKAVLIERILDAEGLNAPKEEEGEIEEVTESHEEVTDETLEEMNEEENGSPEEEGEPTLYDKVVAGTAEMTDEELADILADIGVSPKGKRQALLTKIVQAVEDGKLEWDDEDSDEDGEAESQEEETTVEETTESNDTPERLATMDEIEDRIRTGYKAKEISDKEIVDFLNEYHNGTYKGTKAENLNNYVDIMRALVDEDGEEHEFQEAYYVGEDVHCCGAKVKELEDGNLYCEVCGTTYEV